MFNFAKKMKFKFIGICKNVANNISDYSKTQNSDFSRKYDKRNLCKKRI